MNKFSGYVLGFLVSTSVAAIAGFDYNQCTDLDEKRAHVERKTLALKVYSRQLEGVIGQAVGTSGKLSSKMELLLHLKERLNKKLDSKQKLLQTLNENKEGTASTDSSKVRTVESLKEDGQFWITSAQTLNTAGFKNSDDKLFGSWDLFQGYMDAHPTIKASITAQNTGGMDPVSYAKLVSSKLITYENILAYVQEKAKRSTDRALKLPLSQVADPYHEVPILQAPSPVVIGVTAEALPQQESVMAPSVSALSKPTTLQEENDKLLRDIILHYEEIEDSIPLEVVHHVKKAKLMRALAVRCNSTIEHVTNMVQGLEYEKLLSPEIKSVQKYVESFIQRSIESGKLYEGIASLEDINFKARIYFYGYDPQTYSTRHQDQFQFTKIQTGWFESMGGRAPLKSKWEELTGRHAKTMPLHSYFNESSIYFNFGFDLSNTSFKGFVIFEKPIDFQYLKESCFK